MAGIAGPPEGIMYGWETTGVGGTGWTVTGIVAVAAVGTPDWGIYATPPIMIAPSARGIYVWTFGPLVVSRAWGW
jgi:hypothetical protein